MKLLEVIKKQLKAEGISESYAERILKLSGITEEKDNNIADYVKNFKENVLPLIEQNRTSSEEAARKAIEDYEKKYGLKGGKPIVDNDDDPLPTDLDPAVKAILDNQNKMMQQLTDKLTSLESTQLKANKLEAVKVKMKGRVSDDLIEHFAKQVNLDAEDLEAEIDKAVNVYVDMNQKMINNAVQTGQYQPVEGGGIGANDKDIDSYIESKTKTTDGGPFAGIEL